MYGASEIMVPQIIVKNDLQTWFAEPAGGGGVGGD